MHATI
jgi:hypothetical protein